MDLYDYGRINKYLSKHNNKMDKTFNEIIIDLIKFTNFDYITFRKILEGSYVIIKDNGYFYKKWSNKHKKNLFNNISSHESHDKKYRLGNGYICSLDGKESDTFDFLLGTIKCFKINDTSRTKMKSTWFQLERHRLTNISNILGHIFDYVKYLINNKNIGPFGESTHIEKKNQIILKLNNLTLLN